MSDDTQRPGPDKSFKMKVSAPDEAEDTAGHRFHGASPVSGDAPGPDEGFRMKVTQPDEADDTEGHRFHGT